jgi:ABC-2 type transport system ATP-binding protein
VAGIVIDYEEWDLLWDRTDKKFQKAWKAYVGPKNEYVYRVGYEAAARAFYEATIKRVKELRPAAKVGNFGKQPTLQNVFLAVVGDDGTGGEAGAASPSGPNN